MAVNEWQPGKVYVAGDLAKPKIKTTPGPQALVDGDVEGLTVGSLLTPNWSVDGGTRFTGTKSLRFDGGSSTTAECFLPERVNCTPGETVGVSCMINQGGSSANNAGGAVRLGWFDASDVLIAQNEGTIIKSSSGGWQQSNLSQVVPVGAVKFGVGVNGWHNGSTQPLWADHWVINYTPTAPTLNRLIYKAVQPDAGTSAADEPAWPSTVGVQVNDGTVIWEAVGTGFIVWRASPIMQAGATEPDWPLKEGESVSDGTIIWEARTTRITDPKCPNSKVVVIMASKVFAVDKDIVRYCATANPLDWSTPRDAGYLPTGLQQANSNNMAVLGQFRGNLVAFNANCFQMWQVDPDPEQMALLDQMDGIGSTWKWAAQSVGNDEYFLCQQGVRSVAIAIGAENLAAGDVGSPIDPMIQEALYNAPLNGEVPVATYYPGAGQYWLSFAKKESEPLPMTLTGDLPIGFMGGSYSSQLTLSGTAFYPLTWTSTGLPTGLSFADGMVSGEPATSGLFDVSFTVTDRYGRNATYSTYMRINYSTDAVITRQSGSNGFLHFDGSDNTYPFLQYYTGTTATTAQLFASSADGLTLALMVMASSGGRAQAWRRVGGGFVNDLTIDALPTYLYSMDLSRDGAYLALGENDAASGDKMRIMKRVGSNYGQVASAVPAGSIYSNAMKWHPTGGYIAVSSTSGGGKVFKFQADALTELVGVTFTASDSISWSPNGQYLAVSGGGGIRVYTFQSELLTLLATGSDSGGQHVWSPDSRFIYCAGSATNRLQVFELVGAALIALALPTQPPDYANLNCSISPSGKQLIVGYGTGSGWNNTNTTGTGIAGVSVYEVNGGTLTLSTTETIAFDAGNAARAVHYVGGR